MDNPAGSPKSNKLEYCGLSAWVSSEDSILETFRIGPVPGVGGQSCLVCSKEGKTFKVHVQNTHPDWDISASLYLDGKHVYIRLLRGTETSEITGAYLSSTSERPFAFSKLEFTDDDALAITSTARPEYIGTIHVDFYRVRVNNYPVNADPLENDLTTPILHESSKKLDTHCVRYNDPTLTSPRTPLWVEPYGRPIPIASFIFKYKPWDTFEFEDVFHQPVPQVIQSMPRKRCRSPSDAIQGLTDAKNRRLIQAELGTIKVPEARPQFLM